jgi:hypothetical protein
MAEKPTATETLNKNWQMWEDNIKMDPRENDGAVWIESICFTVRTNGVLL